jgi:hypothetical protein
MEVMIAAIIASLAVIPYLSLSSRETLSTRDLAQRSKAVSLARNTLNLLEKGHRQDLYSGNINNGVYELSNPDLLLKDSFLATGKGLTQWMYAQRQAGHLLYKVTWMPGPPDLTGITGENAFGELTCTVGWLADKKRKKELTLRKITSR